MTDPLEHSLSDRAEEPPKPEPEPAAAPEPAPPSAAPRHDQVGRFRLDRVIGSGGMGVVYEAWDEDLQRRVAVKVLAPGLASQLNQRRFAQEAILAARLQHPNIVAVYEAGDADGRSYIAMEFVEGETLEAKIDSHLGEAASLEGDEREAARRDAAARMTTDQLNTICRWVHDIALALHCGHTSSAPETGEPSPIVHRDVKPQNVMVDARGQARLLDFGLAKDMGVSLTVTREALGTPLYMSPEQLFSSRRVGPRSDVYSLGMTLYACVTLARPFELSNPGQLFDHLMHDEPVDPARLNPGLPADVRTIILEATAKDERQRYASAEDLAADLEAYLEGRPITAKPPGRARRALRFARRRWRPLAVAAALLAAVVVQQTYSAVQENRARQEAMRAKVQQNQQRSQALNEARGDVNNATLIYRLAELSKGEDPDSDRWLTLLNEGHDREQRAEATLRKVGMSNSALGHTALMARVTRNDAKALATLKAERNRSKRIAARNAPAETVMTWLPRLVQSDPDALYASLAALDPQRRPPVQGVPRLEAEALAILTLVGEVNLRADLSEGSRDRPMLGLTRVRARVSSMASAAGKHRRAAKTLTEELERVAENPRLVVVPPAGADLEGARVHVRAWPNGQPGRLLASGALGEAIEVPGSGAVLVCVEQADRTTQLPFQLARRGWGQPNRTQRIALRALPASAPEGMVLATHPGGAFWVDAQEVTVAEYARFLASPAARDHSSCSPEERERYGADKDHTPGSGLENPAPGDPVTGVDHYDALAYARWAGKELPTGAEWHAAASSGMPVNLAGANLRGIDDGYLWVAPADSGHLAPCGARGLIGNVAEWLAREDPDFPFCEAAGASWSEPAERTRLRFDPTARGADLGFRCVKRLPPPSARPPLERTRVAAPDPVDMVLIRAGHYTVETGPPRRGTYFRKGKRDPKFPRRTFTLPAFYLDAEPVSVRRYVAYLDATGQVVEPSLQRLHELHPERPMGDVSWKEASAYAAWAGKRLPTEVELLVAQQTNAVGRVLIGLEKRPYTLPEWCADTYHSEFLRFANRIAPQNRWSPPSTHVVRAGLARSGQKVPRRTGFRCAFTPLQEDD